MTGQRQAAMDPTEATGRTAPRPRRDRLRMAIAIVATVVAVAIAALAMGGGPGGGFTSVTLTGDRSGSPPAVGALAPDFTATTVDGETVSLRSLRGRPVWLTFGASWCIDCRAEAPDLQAAYEAFAGRGLAVLGVFIAEDATAVADYAERVGLTMPLVADPQTRIASRYRLRGLPTHYFIDADGVIRGIRLGGLQPAEMERLLTALLE